MSNQDVNRINLNTRAVSCSINFMRELLKEEGGEEMANEIIEPFFNNITTTIFYLFNKGVEIQNLELLSEVLSFISLFSNLMKEKFSDHYSQYM